MSSNINYQRNPHSDSSQSNKSDTKAQIKKAVAELIKGDLKPNNNDYAALSSLREKYKDVNLIDTIFEQYKDRLKYVENRARKFKDKLFSKYEFRNYTNEQVIKQARKYARRYNLSDDEFQIVLNIIFSERSTNRNTMYDIPTTPMARTLGYSGNSPVPDAGLNMKPTELDTVQEILQLYGHSRALHAQVVLQSMTYRDCAPEAITGGGHFNNAKDNHYSYVHPVIAALFFPKIKLLDEQMLIANLGYIIKAKNDRAPLLTKPDYELFWSMITDPNTSVCYKDSPLKDIYNRFKLQNKLWQSVLNLRQGKYYNEKMYDFLVAIDDCNSNIYEAPDLTYVKDEGTIIRRLLGAFSLRPTVVATTKLYQTPMASAMSINNDLMSNAGISSVTTVPMITMRLPVTMDGKNNPIALSDSISQPQWFVEDKMFVPKSQSIVHSRDVLIFYVPRRFQTINHARTSAPCNFNLLPMTIAGIESLNDRTVNFEKRMSIMSEDYVLRSVVMVECSKTQRNLIVGSTAAIVIPRNITNGIYDESFLLYDPQGAGEMFKFKGSSAYEYNAPITAIPGDAPLYSNNQVESFYERASKRGTIFVYQKSSSYECVDPNTGKMYTM